MKKKAAKKKTAETQGTEEGDALDTVLATIKAGMTMPEVAETTGFHVETLRKWARTGELKTFKVANVVRVHRNDLAEFLAARTVTK